MAMALALRRLSSSIDKSIRPRFNGPSLYYMVPFFLFLFFSFLFSREPNRQSQTFLTTFFFFLCSRLCQMKLSTTKRNPVSRWAQKKLKNKKHTQFSYFFMHDLFQRILFIYLFIFGSGLSNWTLRLRPLTRKSPTSLSSRKLGNGRCTSSPQY